MTAVLETVQSNLDDRERDVGRRIQKFSQLAGPVEPGPRAGESYEVSYRGVDAVHGRGRAMRSLAVGAFAFIFELAVVLWVIQPSHRPPVEGGGFAMIANVFVVGSIVIMECLRVVNVLFVALTSVLARDPIPVEPQSEQRIAFLTTIVPSKEPIDVVRGTLAAALRIRYRGILDVWILDEGNDPGVRAMCRELGVNHFTRKGAEKYNRRSGPYKARTKHGNYNSWVAEHGEYYDIFISVDPDHVPLPNYAERILGYFRDPDVAFVSGPQCYANDETFVTRAAEAQQFLFHSLIQRAANRFNVGMLVGTNNGIRLSALRSVGGLSDSVTEDMATGLKFHSQRNPGTGRRWKSVYTPDVLAVGEGPSSWGDFFSQQMRWSRGTFDVILTKFWRTIPRLSPGAALHYLLLATFYPSMALGWMFGAVNACLFLTVGVQGIVVPVQLWLALYVDAAAIQLWLYLRNRRYNVSPYEAEGSSGLKGMLMSTVSSPIYAASLISSFLRLPAKFVVTPKGLSSSADHMLTFRRHLQWAVVLVVAVIVALLLGYAAPAVLMWPAVMLAACLFPPIAWVTERVLVRRPQIEAAPSSTAEGSIAVTTETLQRAALDALVLQARPASTLRPAPGTPRMEAAYGPQGPVSASPAVVGAGRSTSPYRSPAPVSPPYPPVVRSGLRGSPPAPVGRPTWGPRLGGPPWGADAPRNGGRHHTTGGAGAEPPRGSARPSRPEGTPGRPAQVRTGDSASPSQNASGRPPAPRSNQPGDGSRSVPRVSSEPERSGPPAAVEVPVDEGAALRPDSEGGETHEAAPPATDTVAVRVVALAAVASSRADSFDVQEEEA